MTVKELQTSAVKTCGRDTDLATVAKLMWDGDCGAVPVVTDDHKVIGMITDRDICIAAATRFQGAGRDSRPRGDHRQRRPCRQTRRRCARRAADDAKAPRETVAGCRSAAAVERDPVDQRSRAARLAGSARRRARAGIPGDASGDLCARKRNRRVKAAGASRIIVTGTRAHNKPRPRFLGRDNRGPRRALARWGGSGAAGSES